MKSTVSVSYTHLDVYKRQVDYAEALGATLGPVVHIRDVDPERLRDETRMAGGSGGATTGGQGDLAPGQVTVSAAVVLGFSFRH